MQVNGLVGQKDSESRKQQEAVKVRGHGQETCR